MIPDMFAFMIISDEVRLMTETETDSEKADAWWKTIDGASLLQDCVRWSIVYGNAVFEKSGMVSNQENIVRLKYMDGRQLEFDVDSKNELVKVKQYYESDKSVPFKPDEIVNIRLIPDSDGIHGISLYDRNYDNIKDSLKANEAIVGYVERHAFPKYHIRKTPVRSGTPIPDPVMKNLEKTFEKINSKNEFITDDTVEIVALDKGGKGNLIKEVSDWAMMRIATGFGIPEEMMGMGRGSTEATANVKKEFLQFTISAMRRVISKQLKTQLLDKQAEALGMAGSMWLEFPEITQSEIQKASWLAQVGDILTQDEKRQQLGLQPIDNTPPPQPPKQDNTKDQGYESILKEIKDMKNLSEKKQKTGKTMIKKLSSDEYEIKEV